ncbi:MAG: sulfatase [Thermoanaerobaculia bacterium]
MARQLLVSLLLAALAAGSASPGLPIPQSAVAASTHPNLVFLLTDDQELTLGSLDFMPHTRALLAAQGTTFASHFVPLSLCCPSRSTILTGQYPHNHQVYTNFPPDGGYERFDELGLEQTTLATALHAAGYRTALFGKYLNDYPGTEDPSHVPPGWDEWASPVAGSPYASYHYTLNENGKKVKYGGTAADYMTDVLSGKATDFVRRAAGTGQPFFLYLATYAPHRPSTPAKRHANLFPGIQAPRTPSFNESNVTDKPARIRALRRLKAGQIAAINALYRKQRQALQGVDEAVAAVVQALQDTGELANTYVVFTSDNGFHMGQHRLEPGKYTPYETDVHVPLLIRGPGVPAGATVTSLTSSVDLAPTFTALAGATLPLAPDGRSLVSFLRGQTPDGWRLAVLLEQFAFPPAPPATGDSVIEPPDPQDEKAVTNYPAHLGLRTADFKFVEYDTGEREVYDLHADPDETNNLRNRLPLAWLNSLSGIVHALGNCAGATCRQLESQPVPPLPGH